MTIKWYSHKVVIRLLKIMYCADSQ